MPLFTIISVIYNAEKEISVTLDSVLSQTYTDYEYVIIDGKSTDNTLRIVNSYKKKFCEIGVVLRVISESDSGIYNAMNKGVKLSTGGYICFLNAGDEYVGNNVLERVQKDIKKNVADIYYGDTILKSDNMFKYCAANDISILKYDMPFCHQSIFTSRSLFGIKIYDEKYSVCADHDFYLYCFLNNYTFCYLNYPISIYPMGGFSSNDDSKLYWEERIKVGYDNGIINKKEYIKKMDDLRRRRKRRKYILKIKKLVPSILLEKRKHKILVKDGWVKDRKDANQKNI